MATLDDVAKLAGVSVMTVSRFVNNRGYVGSKSREKIEKAISSLKYRPNMIAKSLITKETKTIGLVVASIINPFYPEVVLGVEDESYERGYNVILCNAEGKKREEEYIQILLEKCVDGIIFSHLNLGIKQMMELKSEKVECVLIDNETRGLDTCNINTNNFLGGFMATEHLIQLGHRKIACIHGSFSFNESKLEKKYEETFQFDMWINRTKGFYNAMERYDVRVNSSYVVEGDSTSENGVKGGCEAMKKILRLVELPTAVYAQNDLMAVGALNAIHEAGFKVPQDFSLIGHDGISLSEWVYPKLTTVAQPRYEIGRAAVRMLLEMKEGKPGSNVELDPVLIVRDSTRQIIHEQL